MINRLKNVHIPPALLLNQQNPHKKNKTENLNSNQEVNKKAY